MVRPHPPDPLDVDHDGDGHATAGRRSGVVLVTCAALLLAVTGACGGDDTSGAGGGSTTTTSASGGGATGGSGGGTGGSAPLCPTTAPSAGAACDDTNLVCAYGDAVLASCRDLWTCVEGAGIPAWTKIGPDPANTTLCSSIGCPPTAPNSGGVCDEAFLGSGCGYDDGTACTCMNCIDQGGGPCMPVDPPQWICPPQPADPCPAIAPNAGTPCDTPSLECLYYGNCGLDAVCVGEAWTWQVAPCAE